MALGPAAVVSASTAAVVGAYFFGAAALHCYADYFVAIEKPDDEVTFGLTVLSLAGSVLYFAKRQYRRRSRERSSSAIPE